MDLQYLREYCLAKKAVTEELPFDESTLVFKVMGKMFLLTNIESFESVNIKCDPELAVELREQYDAVIPGWHMNKKHWNTVIMDGSIPNKLFLEWVDLSYNLVVQGLSKKDREGLV